MSSFLASIFLGRIANIDISDVCGMNLWDIKAGRWNEKLMNLASNGEAKQLIQKLGAVLEDGGGSLGPISKYFVERYGFDESCPIAPFTGDNPATILALPLRSMDAIVSLGTSTTFLMSTPQYKPNPSVHFFNHPTTAGLYMFMLCYKNGGLAREQVRDALNGDSDRSRSWTSFDRTAHSTAPLGQRSPLDPMKLGLYFPRPEIVPNLGAGIRRFHYDPSRKSLRDADPASDWAVPAADARAIVESQLLSLRLRSRDLVESPGGGLPPQPRRIYLVGGGSCNATIARMAGEVLGGAKGVYKLDVGENACALGAAYKAVWATERREGETFEDLIGARWREAEFVERIAEGYEPALFERYGEALGGFAEMERVALEREMEREIEKGKENGTGGKEDKLEVKGKKIVGKGVERGT